MPQFSIIIPVVRINDYIHETVRHLLNLTHQNFEILIFPDAKSEEKFPKTKIIPTGKIGPAEKRTLALQYAEGEILAFLDDDAYPQNDWLSQAAKNFQDPRIAALGGPAISPQDDSLRQKTSGACLASSFWGGIADRYIPGKKKKTVTDWPSVNFLVRKNIFQKIGGFNSQYWPGEDTKFCLDLTQTGGNIIYDPQLIVYHHRRKTLLSHLQQIAGYGLHRGFFAKKFPATSLKFTYFIPSLFVLLLVASPLIGYLAKRAGYIHFLYGYIAILLLYLGGILWAAIKSAFREKNPLVGLLIIPYMFLTHLVYGVKFLQGLLFTKTLKSKLRR